jgi:predicted TIM-barrel fold metal-dependent hydrolase
VEGSIEEIAYALDELDADGFCVLSNHHGIYIGSDIYEPVWAELNRRKAKVFMHPTIPCMHVGGQLVNAMPTPAFPPSIFEFFIEEVRVVLGLFSSRAVTRYPDMTWIIAHCGGALPPIAERFCNFGTMIFGGKEEFSSDKMKQILKSQFYFDLAGFPLPDQIHGLLRLVDPSRLLFGSDFPYTRYDSTVVLSDILDDGLASALGSRHLAEAACLHNAEKLFSK